MERGSKVNSPSPMIVSVTFRDQNIYNCNRQTSAYIAILNESNYIKLKPLWFYSQDKNSSTA